MNSFSKMTLKVMCVSGLALAVITFSATTRAVSLDASPEMRELSQNLVEKGLYSRAELAQLIGDIEIDDGVLKLFERRAEAKPWHVYKNIFLKQKRINAGKAFIEEHADLLNKVDEKYGVPPEIITALIGVETFYGTRMGSRNVLRSLVTLTAAYPRRAKFFGSELETFLGLLKTENLLASDMEGSYAGAIGIPQFMPTSYVAYAIDFNDNGTRDLVREVEDAVGSVANYLVVHGWKGGEPIAKWQDQSVSAKAQTLIAKRAKPKHSVALMQQHGIDLDNGYKGLLSLNKLNEESGTRYFVGYRNFYALTRYNPSNKYAMAIVELAKEIKRP